MLAQILAVVIFIAMFLLIILDKIERHIVTLVSAAGTLLLVFALAMGDPGAIWTTLNLQHFLDPAFWYSTGVEAESAAGINWPTIVFIAGMMIMVEGMARSGLIRWMCLRLASAVGYRAAPLLLVFMLISAILSMFVASITVILFLAAVTIELARLLRFDPLPMILAEVFCANLGGSATMCGDPPNIIIGTTLGYSFWDFIAHTGVMAGISLLATLLFFYLCYRRQLRENDARSQDLIASCPDPRSAISNRRDFTWSCVIFLLAVLLLATHAQTGLTVALVGVLIAALTLLTAWKNAGKLLRGVDYKTLLFLIGLFVVVGGLETTGILEVIAGFIGRVSHGNAILMVLIIMWVSAVASAFVDNIPFAATMVPVIQSLSAATGADLSVLAWGLSMGTDVGGSATPIGASANVVGISVASREGYPISWGRYCKISAPATVVVMVISSLYMVLRYF